MMFITACQLGIASFLFKITPDMLNESKQFPKDEIRPSNPHALGHTMELRWPQHQ